MMMCILGEVGNRQFAPTRVGLGRRCRMLSLIGGWLWPQVGRKGRSSWQRLHQLNGVHDACAHQRNQRECQATNDALHWWPSARPALPKPIIRCTNLPLCSRGFMLMKATESCALGTVSRHCSSLFSSDENEQQLR